MDASVKAGGDSKSCERMCSTKGRCVATPCETRSLKADLSRAGGTGHRGEVVRLLVLLEIVPVWCTMYRPRTLRLTMRDEDVVHHVPVATVTNMISTGIIKSVS